jgi:hypothetical protein
MNQIAELAAAVVSARDWLHTSVAAPKVHNGKAHRRRSALIKAASDVFLGCATSTSGQDFHVANSAR